MHPVLFVRHLLEVLLDDYAPPNSLGNRVVTMISSVRTVIFLEQWHRLPPTNFLETLAQVQLQEEVRKHIQDLVARKLAGDELQRVAEGLSQMIE